MSRIAALVVRPSTPYAPAVDVGTAASDRDAAAAAAPSGAAAPPKKVTQATASQGPLAAPPAGAGADATGELDLDRHPVAAGESWESIAAGYGVDAAQLKAANPAAAAAGLQAGQTLAVPSLDAIIEQPAVPNASAAGTTAPTTGATAPTTGAAAPTTGATAPTTGAAAPTTGATAPTTGAADGSPAEGQPLQLTAEQRHDLACIRHELASLPAPSQNSDGTPNSDAYNAQVADVQEKLLAFQGKNLGQPAVAGFAAQLSQQLAAAPDAAAARNLSHAVGATLSADEPRAAHHCLLGLRPPTLPGSLLGLLFGGGRRSGGSSSSSSSGPVAQVPSDGQSDT